MVDMERVPPVIPWPCFHGKTSPHQVVAQHRPEPFSVLICQGRNTYDEPDPLVDFVTGLTLEECAKEAEWAISVVHRHGMGMEEALKMNYLSIGVLSGGKQFHAAWLVWEMALAYFESIKDKE